MPETLPSASVSEKVSQVNEERKKYYAEVARTYGKNESYICESVKKEKKFVLLLLMHLTLQNYGHNV